MNTSRANQSQYPQKRLLTIKQVAEWLQWNPYTILKKAVRGELPGFKLGREWRFREEDMLAWIDSKRNGTKT